MARSDDSAPLGRPPKLGRKLFLARLVLAWEFLWPSLWPAVGIAGLFLALALFDFFAQLPGWLHVMLLAAFAIFFVRALVRTIRNFVWPAQHAGRRRLEQASGLDHRPLTAVNDSQATGTNDRAAAELWRAHQARMAALSRNLRAGIPEPGLARRDPWALRLALAIILVVAGVTGWSDPLQRLSRAVMPTLQTDATAQRMAMDLWITPPGYTGLPPLFPLRLTKQAAAEKAGRNSAASPHKDANEKDAASPGLPVIQVPAGSILTAQVQGKGQLPELVLDSEKQGQENGDAPEAAVDTVKKPFEKIDQSYSRIVHEIDRNGTLSITAGDRTLGEWQISIIPDLKPAIAFANPPAGTPQATFRISYTASDDYGITKAQAEIRRTYERGEVVGKEVHRIDLPLPSRAARSVNETAFFDLAPHKWAGQPVMVELLATDGLKQKGKSEPVRLVLPERVFTHPVARAIIEERKKLANQPERRRSVMQGLSEIASAPQAFDHDSVVYLALATARSRLIYGPGNEAVDPILGLLWDTALRLEDGKLSIAERELRRIQQALMKALAEGASDAELERLMRQLRQAISNYMQALAEQMRRNPNRQQQAVEFDPRTMRLIQGSDIARMLDQIRKLMQSGARQAAREMLARLQRMLEGMRSMQVMRQRGSGGRNSGALRKLQDLIRRQQQLMEQTFRSARPGAGQQGRMPGAGDQKALQNLLRQLRGMMPGSRPGQGPGQALDRANQAMERAIRSLEGRRPGDAVGAQGQALDQLRRAGRGLLQQMMERFARQSGNRPNRRGDRNQPRRDPLGRETMGDDVETGGVKIPNESAMQRAREILEELRRRSGQINRGEIELDYINRLLQRF